LFVLWCCSWALQSLFYKEIGFKVIFKKRSGFLYTVEVLAAGTLLIGCVTVMIVPLCVVAVVEIKIKDALEDLWRD
jgi:hypothetical protein